MTSLDLTAADAAMKQYYNSAYFKKTAYNRRPMIGMMPKDPTFFGRNKPLVQMYSNPAGASADFATAQAVASPAKFEDFLWTRVNLHQVATIDGETLEAMSNDSGAFIDAMEAQLEGAIRAVSDRLEALLPGDQTGSLGSISAGSDVTTGVITLAKPGDAYKFQVGMAIVASETAGGALRNSGASETLAKINRNTGELTSTSTDWDDVITAIAAGDTLYAKGDAKNNGTAKVTAGWASWFPATAPSNGEAFFGVDRSTDSQLYGTYHDGTSQLIKTAIVYGQSKCAANGGVPDTGFIHHVNMRELLTELETTVTRVKTPARDSGGKEIAKISYSGVVVQGDEGEIVMVAANKMTVNVVFLLELQMNVYGSIKELVRFNQLDGNKVLRQASSDGVEARVVHRGNFGSKFPAANGQVALAAA